MRLYGMKRCISLNNSYTNLPEEFFSRQLPAKVPSPRLIIWNEELAKELMLPSEFFCSEEGIAMLVGNDILPESIPIAQAYAGHQFGYFTMLGDGRAILLGELLGNQGTRYDLQLKGAGQTPYSRGGDGKATLGPMLREYIISEAMKGLGIPTTRSLAVLTTGESIQREEVLPGAILVRVAKSHLRVGTFQFANHFLSKVELKALADYAIERHYKEGMNHKDRYRYLLQEVIKAQASLVAKWQLVGFIHGVMNTDNMTISGETIDYGPCAFMDTYRPDTVFSSIDTAGRYSYQNQPKMASWNLARFAESLLPLLDENEERAVLIAQEEINQFTKQYFRYWYDGMRKKLGLWTVHEMDQSIIEALFSMMVKYKADFTNTFFDLTTNQSTQKEMTNSNEFLEWRKLWEQRREKQGSKVESVKLMETVNPVVIPRNYRVEEALHQAVRKHDLRAMNALLAVVRKPYDYHNIIAKYQEPPRELEEGYRTYCGT